jgi:hypothetical protein
VDRVTIAPEVLIVVFHRLAHLPQSVCGDDEEQVMLMHGIVSPQRL